MPRNKLTKDEIKYLILEQKNKISKERATYEQKAFANYCLNEILNKIEEFRY